MSPTALSLMYPPVGCYKVMDILCDYWPPLPLLYGRIICTMCLALFSCGLKFCFTSSYFTLSPSKIYVHGLEVELVI